MACIVPDIIKEVDLSVLDGESASLYGYSPIFGDDYMLLGYNLEYRSKTVVKRGALRSQYLTTIVRATMLGDDQSKIPGFIVLDDSIKKMYPCSDLKGGLVIDRIFFEYDYE